MATLLVSCWEDFRWCLHAQNKAALLGDVSFLKKAKGKKMGFSPLKTFTLSSFPCMELQNLEENMVHGLWAEQKELRLMEAHLMGS